MRYHFADCVIDDQAFTLSRNGQIQSVEPQVYDLIHFMVRNPAILIDHDTLIAEVWGGRIVSDSAISARISAARRAVGDNGKAQSIIRTVPRRGFQFVAQVSHLPELDDGNSGQQSRPTVRFATADDGVKIAYTVTGSGPPLINIAHHPTHIELDWDEPFEQAYCAEMGKHFLLVRLDQRGCGLSDLDVEDFSAERSARDVLAVVDDLGIDKFIIKGSSSGGMIAVTFATLFPEWVSHQILLGGYVDGRAIRGGGSSDDNGEVILQMAQTGWDTPGSAFVTGYLSVYLPTASQEQLSLIAGNLQKSCPVENEIRGRSFFNNHSIADLLPQVKTPTLVLHSREDAVHPVSEAQKLAKGIANAQLLVLESRNHFPLPDEACFETMNNAIKEFMKPGAKF